MSRRTLETLAALLVIVVLFYFLMVRVILVKEPLRTAPVRTFGAVEVETRSLTAHVPWPGVELSGSLAPAARLVLSAETGGRVVEVLADWHAGREVAAGERLFAVDATPFELARATAAAQLAEARAVSAAATVEVRAAEVSLPLLAESREVAGRERARLAGLVKTGEASPSTADAALGAELQAKLAEENGRSALARARAALAARKAAAGTAEAALAQAVEALRHLALEAPFAGTLTADGPELGSLLTPGGSLFSGAALGELVDLGELRLIAQAHESQLTRIELGARAIVELPARPGLQLQGSVVRIAPLADRLTRSLAVEIRVPQPEVLRLSAGLFARARIAPPAGGPPAGVLWIERGEFVWSDGAAVAFCLEDEDEAGVGLAAPHVLELGASIGEGFFVLAGLSPGDELIRGPLDRLDPARATSVRRLRP